MKITMVYNADGLSELSIRPQAEMPGGYLVVSERVMDKIRERKRGLGDVRFYRGPVAGQRFQEQVHFYPVA